MSSAASAEQILREIEEYRVGQRVRVRELRGKLQATIVELRARGMYATVRSCERLDVLLKKRTQLIEGALLRFAERSKDEELSKIGPITIMKLVELVEGLDDAITTQVEIPQIAHREGNYQRRLARGYDILLGNRALFDHMMHIVQRDLVGHATMDLVTRLHELNMVVPQLPRGPRRRELVDYRFALKNIGTFVRFVKKIHKIFCVVYPDQGM